MSKFSKREASYHHFRARLRERFGLASYLAVKEIIGKVKRGQAHFIGQARDKCDHFLVEAMGRVVWVVYSKEMDIPVTAMTLRPSFDGLSAEISAKAMRANFSALKFSY